ncbi:hypothetical protein [Microbacterium sp.]|uniref:hypothetical protein n=1 Tax=Microbacterium sp. TaxID=51671 RepID=UPI0035B128FA
MKRRASVPVISALGCVLVIAHAVLAEAPGTAVTLVILGTGVALAILVFALMAFRPDASGTAATLFYLLMLVFGAPAFFAASFGPGMSLADTYGISGADYAPWGKVLYLVSAVALIAAVVVAVTHMPVRRAPAATTAASA